MRKLVTIRKIDELRPIENADMIECAVIDGWTVVVKKGEFQENQPCVFFEVDSFLPADDERYAFLVKNGTKKDESGEERIRLRTVKLRKQLSQGLALPLSLFPELPEIDSQDDMSELLNVIKYERPEPKAGNAAGNFPSYLRRTDEERVQNIYKQLKYNYADEEFYATMKLDGSSCTVAFLGTDMKDHWVYGDGFPDDTDVGQRKSVCVEVNGVKRGEIIVCSRNMQLKIDDDSHFIKAVRKHELLEQLVNIDFWSMMGNSFAIQGEVCGPGIQGNQEKLSDYEFFAFNLFDIYEQEYQEYRYTLGVFDLFNIQMVPLIEDDPFKVFQELDTLDALLGYADGPSLNAKLREGVVFKSADHDVSFKVISNKWLLKMEK